MLTGHYEGDISKGDASASPFESEAMKKYFTSESVTQGHPDKICDIVADSILDAILEKDKNARCAVEVCVTTNFMLIMGETSSKVKIDAEKTARETIKEIGYNTLAYGFSGNNCIIENRIHEQSADIAMGVDKGGKEDDYDSVGAGDQGMMFGFACNETKELMPLPIMLASKITKRLAQVREQGIISYLRPDGKAQVTVEYENDSPKRIDTIVVSAQHNPGIERGRIENDIKEHVINAVIPKKMLDKKTVYYVNPTGQFIIGGPSGDSGLTGRKIIVDTYGGYCKHGGGSFSGKDATKVDRSATYMARCICKNIVAAKLASKCEMQVCYAIGIAKPVSVFIDTYGTGQLPDNQIADIIKKEFDLRPKAIIDKLGLRAPIFKKTAFGTHFGNPDFAWEKMDKVSDLKKHLP